MSQENVEIVQRLVAAVQRGDLPVVMAAYDAEVELDQSHMVDGGVFHGHDGVRAFFRRWFGTWDELQITPERFIDVDEDRVLVLLELKGRGKGSGIPVSVRSGDMFTLAHGKIVRLKGYRDQSDALKAVGLAE